MRDKVANCLLKEAIYQSKENAKHTLRGMQENARQGYYNGAKASYGYKTVDTGQTGVRGRVKKRLAIDPDEAEIVREIFALYVGSKKDVPPSMPPWGADFVEMSVEALDPYSRGLSLICNSF